MRKYDYVFVLDYNSLLSERFFSIYDIETSDIRVVTTEMHQLNVAISIEKDLIKKERYKNIVNKINEFSHDGKIMFLGENNDVSVNDKLLEIIIKNYYLKNILVISNDKKRIEKFLPLIPVYETFGKLLDVGYIDLMLEFYEFEDKDNALSCVSDFDDFDDDFDDLDDL